MLLPREVESLEARLDRIQQLADQLALAQDRTRETRDVSHKLTREIEIARLTLRPTREH